jgi:lipid A oxidase
MRTTSKLRQPAWIPIIAVTCTVALAAPARAETQISVFGGVNENFSSRVKLDKGAVSEDRSMDWDGKSFDPPPYWGVRGTYWFNSGPGWSVALDYVHAKAYADLDFKTDPTYSRLEFTDGLNLLTLNAMYRFAPVLNDRLVPYVGAGAGLSIPHVEVSLKAYPDQNTFEYQLTGVAAQALAGLEYRLGSSWSVFAEARLSYARVEADLAGGGNLETDIWSPQWAIGLSYRFGAP